MSNDFYCLTIITILYTMGTQFGKTRGVYKT